MSAINKFANIADYNAHTKSTTNSEVSLVVTPKDLHYDGLNVENKHKIPAIGDCLYLDSDGKRHFFYGATVNNVKLVNDGYTPVGIVAHKYGNGKVLLIYKEENESVQFCSACIQLLSDYKTDGTANNIKVRWFNSSNVKTVISNTFTDSCSSLQDFVTKFDTFLRNNQVSSYNWHCELMQIEGNNEACVIIDNYYQVHQYQSVIESGATASIYNWNFVGQTTDYDSVLRISGGMGYRTGCNKARLMEYYSTNASESSGMTDSPTDGNGIANKTDFDNGVYPNIKSYYGDWESYIDSILMQRKPTLKGDQIKMPDAYGLTKAMASVTYNDINGNIKKLFSAADWCSSISVLNNDWYLTGINELNDIFIKIKNDASDPINIAMLNMSNKKMVFNVGSTNYYRWISARRHIRNAWCLGTTGPFHSFSIHSRNRAVACQLLSI